MVSFSYETNDWICSKDGLDSSTIQPEQCCSSLKAGNHRLLAHRFVRHSFFLTITSSVMLR